MSARVTVIGLDGATFRVLRPLVAAGAMPHLARLLAEGASGVLESVIPTNSMAAWGTFATGRGPGKHGIFEFQAESEDGAWQRTVVNARHLPVETLWQILTRHGRSVGAINVPLTYPPFAVRGWMVSGIVVPSGSRRFTHPPELADDLRREVGDYVIAVEWQTHQDRPRDLLRALGEMTRGRIRALRYLLARETPEFVMAVFTSTDQMQHALWRDLEGIAAGGLDASPAGGAIADHFRLLDEAIGDLVAQAGGPVLVISDHGFQSCERQLDLNEWLARQGLLRSTASWRQRVMQSVRQLRGPLFWRLRHWYRTSMPARMKPPGPSALIDWSRTVAYCRWSHQEGVWINLRGREPNGIVDPADYRAVRDDLRARLLGMTDPHTGRRVIRLVRTREEYYGGPYVAAAPDLVLIPEDGYRVAPPRHRGMLWQPTGWASGGHSLDGILVAAGPGVRPGEVEGARLVDLAPTILYLLDLPVPADMDGRVLVGLLDPDLLAARPVRFEAPRPAGRGGRGDDVYSPEEEQDVRQQLRGLGYLS